MSIIGTIIMFIIGVIGMVIGNGTVPPAVAPDMPETPAVVQEVATDYTPASDEELPFVPENGYNPVYGQNELGRTVEYNVMQGDKECVVNALYYYDGSAVSGINC